MTQINLTTANEFIDRHIGPRDRKSLVDLEHDISGVISVSLDIPGEQDAPLT